MNNTIYNTKRCVFDDYIGKIELDKIHVARDLARLVVRLAQLISILSQAKLASQLGSLTSQLDTSSNELSFTSKNKDYICIRY
jgi:hypothetical protein